MCIYLFVYSLCSDEIRTLIILFGYAFKVAFMSYCSRCTSSESMFLGTYFPVRNKQKNEVVHGLALLTAVFSCMLSVLFILESLLIPFLLFWKLEAYFFFVQFVVFY